MRNPCVLGLTKEKRYKSRSLCLSLSAHICQSSRQDSRSLALPAYNKFPFLFCSLLSQPSSCMVMKQSVVVMVEQVSHAGLRDYSVVEVTVPEGRRIAPAPASHCAPTGWTCWMGPGPALMAHSGNSCWSTSHPGLPALEPLHSTP